MAKAKRTTRSKTARVQGEKPEAPLTIDQIVATTIDLIEANGPDSFSMRSLAAALDVYPTALYWHVGNRSELLSLVSAEWARDLVPPPSETGWEDWTRELARRYRSAAHRQPNVARLLGVEIFGARTGLNLPERAVGALSGAGLEPEEIVLTYNAMAGAIVGFVNVEIARIEEDVDDQRAVIESELRHLDPDEYPNLVAHMDQLIDRTIGLRWSSGTERPLDASFERLLGFLIGGTRQLIESSPRSS
jgi:TetR/AcrR family transcriptional regulator, tetracycline repressor protein